MSTKKGAQPKRRSTRNSLTGAPLVPGMPTSVTLAEDHTSYGYRASSDDLTMISPPLVLNVSPHRGGSQAVGLTLAPRFVRYLSADEQRDRQERVKVGDRAWWLNPYGKRLVQQRLAEWYRPFHASLICRIAQDYHATNGNGGTPVLLIRQVLADCDRLARSHRRGCECPNCQRNPWTPSYPYGRI